MRSEKKLHSIIDKLFVLIEEGRLYKYIQATIIIGITLYVIITGIEFTSSDTMIVKNTNQSKQYHIRKVSRIPEKKKKENAEKLAVKDDNKLSIDDLKTRYYNYVVSKIESKKVFPLEEQKKGHEGSVVVRIFINRNGQIEKVQLLRRARYVPLTQAAIAAIKQAYPFKPYSKRITDDYLILKLSINFFLR